MNIRLSAEQYRREVILSDDDGVFVCMCVCVLCECMVCDLSPFSLFELHCECVNMMRDLGPTFVLATILHIVRMDRQVPHLTTLTLFLAGDLFFVAIYD